MKGKKASGAGLSDGAVGELTTEEMAILVEDPDAFAERTAVHVDLPDRPAKSAKVADWVDYAVSLGADRTFITQETEHTAWTLVEGRPEEVTVLEPALEKDDLIELADRLGG